MARIDDHIVRLHGILDLVDDRLTRCLDTQNLGNLDDMVRRSLLSHNT